MASVVRPSPASKASKAPRAVKAAPSRSKGDAQSAPEISTARSNGAGVPATPDGVNTAKSVTATTPYNAAVPASAITIARGMLRLGRRTSSPRVAIRA